ncbi:MAG: hypothetical protein JSV09_07010 [Thermoplasmata archaeon]|nr:MAG: hypothetical protein JSV09_07010 [Thermoplasmata archaeon]
MQIPEKDFSDWMGFIDIFCKINLNQLFSLHLFNLKGINTANINLNMIMFVHFASKQTIKGITMDQKEIYMREWEKRYDSYLSYRYQYLFVSIVMVLFVSGSFTLAFAFKFDYILKIILLSAPTLVMIIYYYAHVVAEVYLKQLAQRMRALEVRLKMGPFHTVDPLLFAVKTSQIIGVISFLFFFSVLLIALLEIA